MPPETASWALRPSRTRAAVRVLVQNIYGRDEKECRERYKALAAKILAADPPFDVVAFQEHWKPPLGILACDASVLTKAMEADGRYAGAGRSIKHLPSTTDALQVAGGVSIFTRHRIVDAYQNRFVNSTDMPLSGYAMARMDAMNDPRDLWLELGKGDGFTYDCSSNNAVEPCRYRERIDYILLPEDKRI